MKTLELLAPAKDLECGMAAIDHGADAVYIGAQRFGARAAAGNDMEDLRRLCEYAHLYQAKVYVALNTLIYENELQEAERLVHDIYDAGADAIIIQDMSIMEMILPPISIHASTQTDNRDVAQVRWLANQGLERVVLARELDVKQIAEIHRQVPEIELEAFVHGALCVSFSGLCYASQYVFERSANRGECSQFCRLKFDLVDAENNLIKNQKHLLSLKDMKRVDHLSELIQAGVTSFKIEGRLKDVTYVKNVVSAYSMAIDKYIADHPQTYKRASIGRTVHHFTPDLYKTFNRGYTDYFEKDKTSKYHSHDTPKSLGEYLGVVNCVDKRSFTIRGNVKINNGDGLCYFNQKNELKGIRINRSEGSRLFPLQIPEDLKPGNRVYRNSDMVFLKFLQQQRAAERKIDIRQSLALTDDGFCLQAEGMGADGQLIKAVFRNPCHHEKAKNNQEENIKKQLTKTGNTPFRCIILDISKDVGDYFIPTSVLNDMRRQVLSMLHEQYISAALKRRKNVMRQSERGAGQLETDPRQGNRYYRQYSYMYNASNSISEKFYVKRYGEIKSPAMEILGNKPQNALLMQCKYCIKHALGHCNKYGGKPSQWVEPLYLVMSDGRKFRLEFDCKLCQMNVYA